MPCSWRRSAYSLACLAKSTTASIDFIAGKGSMPIRSRLESRRLASSTILSKCSAANRPGPLGRLHRDGQCRDVHAQLGAGPVQFGDVFRGHRDLGDLDGVVADRADLAERLECPDFGEAVLQHHRLYANFGCFSHVVALRRCRSQGKPAAIVLFVGTVHPQARTPACSFCMPLRLEQAVPVGAALLLAVRVRHRGGEQQPLGVGVLGVAR